MLQEGRRGVQEGMVSREIYVSESNQALEANVKSVNQSNSFLEHFSNN